MGKKTEVLLKTLGTQAEACAQTAGNLSKVLAAWQAVDKEWDKWEPEMKKLAKWDDHPYVKKRSEVWQKGKDVLDKLQGDIHTLNMTLGEFKGFVSKKEKAKTFKTKNSLPSAKQAIKMYDDAVKSLLQLFQTGRNAFN